MNINNIYFYLLLGVFLYFLFTYILEKYLVEQENFDPSLVPVSSIVTLAKVAQKLVNGNGTLTNPGNLQIGKDMQATGNLTVTGKTSIGSTTMGNNTLNVTGTVGVNGNTAMIGSLSVNGPLTVASNQNFNVTGNTTMGGTLGVTGDSNIGGNLGVIGATLLGGNTKVGGTLEVTGNTKVGGTLKVTGNTTVDGRLILTNTTEGAGYITSGEDKTGIPGRLHISNGEDLFLLPKGTTHVSSAWGGTGNLNVSGNTTVGGNLIIGGTIRSQLTVVKLGQIWDDRGFIEKMVPYFKKSDPDGTRIDFMLVHDNGSVRLQSGVKYGNVMLRVYQTTMNGGDIGDWGPKTTSSSDTWRINLTQ